MLTKNSHAYRSDYCYYYAHVQGGAKNTYHFDFVVCTPYIISIQKSISTAVIQLIRKALTALHCHYHFRKQNWATIYVKHVCSTFLCASP